jgi:hypothetical protein
MSSREDILDGALRQLREASNPGADERARILAAVRALGTSSAPAAPRALPGETPRLGVRPLGVGQGSMLRHEWLVWGFAFGLATFGIGVGIGVGFGLGRGAVAVRPPELDPTPLPAAPPAPPAAPRPSVAAPEPRFHERPTEPPAMRRQPKQRPKPRPPTNATLAQPAPGALTLAEALELVHRAERAIYSDNAAWALSLLDQLDERAPRDMLHEERIATRILALCADGQVDSAERLASQARDEAPASIYGALLERACNGARVPAQHSPRP